MTLHRRSQLLNSRLFLHQIDVLNSELWSRVQAL
jgi:hypothetical protein